MSHYDETDEMDLPDREIDQALLDLEKYGVCRSDAIYGLLKRGYADCYSQWFKPIPWSIHFAEVNQMGRTRLLSIEIEDLDRPENERLLQRDLYITAKIGMDYTGHLIFNGTYIETEIEKGNHVEIARCSDGDISARNHGAYLRDTYPDYFSSQHGNDKVS